MIRRHHILSSIPLVLIAAAIAYLYLFIGTLSIDSGTLDPASLSVNGKHYSGTHIVIHRLPFRVYRITETQADYYSVTKNVVLIPWFTNRVSLHPQTTPDGERAHQIRQTAANVSAKWGTYSSRDIGSYVGRVKAVSTPNLYNTVFLSDSYVRGRDFDQGNGTVNKVVPYATSLVSDQGKSATVLVKLRISATAHNQTFSRSGEQTVHLVLVNGAWLADGITEVSS